MNIELEHLHRDTIERHHLQGLVYSRTQNEEFQSNWKHQVLKNHCVQAELKNIERAFEIKKIPICLLKGFALLGDVYQDWGARFASDVDFLVDYKDLERSINLLVQQGYEVQNEDKWMGNDFKVVMTKQTPLVQMTLELHTQLFWHTSFRDYSFSKGPQHQYFSVLSPEEQLLHLCGHLSFQHTFLKLFWFFDIRYFLESYEDKINWDRFWELAQTNQLVEASELCLFLAKRERALTGRKSSVKQNLLRKVCSKAFLMHPRKHWVRYFTIKYLIKDQSLQNLTYLAGWFRLKLTR